MKFRARSSRWFEQKRRKDAAVSLSVGITAAFGAPFAGYLLPIELGVGGNNISGVIAVFSAFLGTKFLAHQFSVSFLDIRSVTAGFYFSNLHEWLGTILIGGVGGLMGVMTIHSIRYCEESLLNLFQTKAWMRIMAGALLLSLVYFIYQPFHRPVPELLEAILWFKFTPGQVVLSFFVQLLALALVLSGFGTAGLFWPLFALGGTLGFSLNHWALHDLVSFSGTSGVIGGAALWGAVLGVPVTGAVLAMEMTQNLNVFLPALVAALIAHSFRKLFRTPTLLEKDLDARGIHLIDGRSALVLDSLTVRDAMTADHEIVHEQEPISELHTRVLKFPYPFVPVVNTQGMYVGLLTIDMIQEAWLSQGSSTEAGAHAPLSSLLEAKDLLYRSGLKTPTVRSNDRLSSVMGFFKDIPCAPVLGDDGRVIGLLFVYHIRLAYDREVARRSFSFVGEGKNARSSIVSK